MKTVLFVPGGTEDYDSRDHATLFKMIEGRGYSVVFVPIKWARATIDSWVKDLDAVYSQYDPKDVILAGFSWGAMTAFVGAVERNPSELWLFSLSPYFEEDIKARDMNGAWLKNAGHRRVTAFQKLSFTKLIQKLTCKVVYFYGKAELEKWPSIEYRHQAVEAHKNMETILIQDALHDVTSDLYMSAIEKAI